MKASDSSLSFALRRKYHYGSGGYAIESSRIVAQLPEKENLVVTWDEIEWQKEDGLIESISPKKYTWTFKRPAPAK